MTSPPPPADRQSALGLLAAATATELAEAMQQFVEATSASDLKAPEVGLVMLRGRIGSDGAAFNVGEATVARAVVQLASGEVGYGMRLGRDLTAARNAAILDALWTRPGTRAQVDTILTDIAARRNGQRADASAEAAATRVDFFTLSRGSE